MDQDIKEQFEKLDKHLGTMSASMVTKEDLKQAIAPLATKAELSLLREEIGEKFEEFREEMASKDDLNNVLTAIDGLAKQITTYHQEMVFLSRRIERMESWIRAAAAKLQIPFED